VETAAGVATTLATYWVSRGSLVEARVWLERVLALHDGMSGESKASVLMQLGHVAVLQGDYARADLLLGDALDAWRAIDSPEKIAKALQNLGYLALCMGEYERAILLMQEAIDRHEAVGFHAGAACGRSLLGLSFIGAGETERGLTLLEQTVDWATNVGDAFDLAGALLNLGEGLIDIGDYGRADEALRRGLAAIRGLDERLFLIGLIESLATCAALSERHARFASLSGVAERLREEGGLGAQLQHADRAIDSAGRACEVLGEDGFAAAWNRGRAMTTDDAFVFAAAVDEPVAAPDPVARF
jgi:non-specific serine/threonine protein kinase